MFLDAAILGIVGGDDDVRIFAGEFGAGGKHAGGHEVEAGAGNKAAQDAAGAGLVERIGCDNDVGELLRHNQAAEGGIWGVAGVLGVLGAAAFPPRILNITVPQVGHLPLMALRPFFMVSSTPSAISFLALHLTQYPSAIEFFRP
jgi:hypothetical protein